MPALFWITVLTLVGSALLWGASLYALSGRTMRYLGFIIPALPLPFLVNLVKRPLPGLLASATGIEPVFRVTSPWWFLLFVALLAPVTEELIKILPLGIPQWRKSMLRKETALWIGLALGIGFGLGEVAYLAYGMAKVPSYLALPWPAFTGFAGERLVIVGAHGLMTAVAVYGLAQGRVQGILGYLSAVGLHLMVNSGSLLAALRWMDPGFAQVLLVVVLLVLIGIFEYLRRISVIQASKGSTVEILFER